MPVAIVTGGASGIGLAITKYLVSRNYQVTMADMNEDAGKRESQALGEQTSFVRCDVSSWDSQVELFEAAKKKWGQIDVFVANAGASEQVGLLDNPTELSKPSTKSVEVNLNGTIYSLRLAVFYFKQNGGRGGRFISTSSQTGIYGFPLRPVYAATKSAINTIIRSTASQLAKEKIYVNCFAPGLTATPATKELVKIFADQKLTPMENHIKAVETFLDTDIHGAVMESDSGGLYNRKRHELWSAEHQDWVTKQEEI